MNPKSQIPNLKFQIGTVKKFLTILAASAILWSAAGCQEPQRPISQGTVSQGKITIEQAVAALNAQHQPTGPIQATSRCVLQWLDADNKTRRESFDAQVRVVPPDKIFFRGDKFGEIRFGTNENEFWLRIKPEMDTYWYGTRQQAQKCPTELLLNPCNLAEAVGRVEIDTTWELFHRDGWDWLTLREQGRPVKRIYVDCNDYRISRIEYFDREGQVMAATELSNYTQTGNGVLMPTTIRLITIYKGLEESSAQFGLQGIRRLEATEAQMEKLFRRPGRDSYGTVLRLDDYCNFIEEN